jgi:FkbM family methyltransferase
VVEFEQVMNFDPIDFTGARLHRHLLLEMASVVAAISRLIWQRSDASRSTWHERTLLWQFIWKVNRYVDCLPRAQSYELEVKMSPEIRMRLDLARLTDSFAYCFGVGESEIGYVCSLFCEPEAVVLDVGAGVGTTTLAFAEKVPFGTVHAFEPSSGMRNALLANIALCGFKNVLVHPFGLSDSLERGQLQLAMVGNPGSAYFTPDNQTTQVELRVLDEVLDADERVDFVKIDVEGYEYRVLLGGSRLILRHKPILVVEINQTALERAGGGSDQLFHLLYDWGYQLLYVDRGQFFNYIPEEHVGQGIHNIIAVHVNGRRVQHIVQRFRDLGHSP